MKTSRNTLKSLIPHIKNTFKYNYSNGKLEGKNNLIKVFKRIAFGYRNFKNLRTRIFIYQNIKITS